MLTRRKLFSTLAAIATGAGIWALGQGENLQIASAKHKKTKTPTATATEETTMPSSRYVATIPNFTPADGDYIIPNSDTVTTNFVLQGDNGGGFADIPVTEYELFAKSGYVAQRVTDLVSGNLIDWTAFEVANGGNGYRISSYTVSVSNTRSHLTNQIVVFAQDGIGYDPRGQVGEVNGEALKNAIVNILIAAGANVVIDDDGIQREASPSAIDTWVSSNSVVNSIVVQLLTSAYTDAVYTVYPPSGGDTANSSLVANDGASVPTILGVHSSNNGGGSHYAYAGAGSGTFLGFMGNNLASTPTISDGAGLDWDGKIFRLRQSKTPSSLTDTGNAGEICWDANYLWVCIAANTWRRFSLTQSANAIASLLFGNLMVSTVALSSTAYFGAGMTATTITEANARTTVNFAGAARNFSVRTSTAQVLTGTLVFTVLKNGSGTTVTITISAGAAAGVFSDTSHSFTFAAGDEISFSAVNNGLGASAAIQGFSLELDAA